MSVATLYNSAGTVIATIIGDGITIVLAEHVTFYGDASSPSNRDVSAGGEPSSGAGPQAQAPHAGTGSETLADREGHSEGTALGSLSVVPLHSPEGASEATRHLPGADAHRSGVTAGETATALPERAPEMDRDEGQTATAGPVAAENALEAPGNGAGCVSHAGPGESPGAIAASAPAGIKFAPKPGDPFLNPHHTVSSFMRGSLCQSLGLNDEEFEPFRAAMIAGRSTQDALNTVRAGA